MTTSNDTLEEFLSHVVPSKEASLCITTDEVNIAATEMSLRSSGFSGATTPLELFYGIKNGERMYLVLTETNAKQIYDLILQYPTGEINFFDREKMETLRTSPNYEHTAVIVLASIPILEKLEAHGLAFRSVTGLAYHNA
jgi:hypothetical protein